MARSWSRRRFLKMRDLCVNQICPLRSLQGNSRPAVSLLTPRADLENAKELCSAQVEATSDGRKAVLAKLNYSDTVVVEYKQIDDEDRAG